MHMQNRGMKNTHFCWANKCLSIFLFICFFPRDNFFRHSTPSADAAESPLQQCDLFSDNSPS